ncbi:hypothetical protein L249_2557, partial [Ophiocordyceps polyrhachis-furcata BCC 54312]
MCHTLTASVHRLDSTWPPNNDSPLDTIRDSVAAEEALAAASPSSSEFESTHDLSEGGEGGTAKGKHLFQNLQISCEGGEGIGVKEKASCMLHDAGERLGHWNVEANRQISSTR